MMRTGPRTIRFAATIGFVLLIAACARQVPDAVDHARGTPGFWWGVWHGFVFPFAWIGSLFDRDIAVYAAPNTGGWYDFGYFVGVTVLGGGSHFTGRKTRSEWRRERRREARED
jgi:hypothetical protein